MDVDEDGAVREAVTAASACYSKMKVCALEQDVWTAGPPVWAVPAPLVPSVNTRQHVSALHLLQLSSHGSEGCTYLK